MDCKEIQERLHEYAEALLAPEESGVVKNHLNQCDDCTRELEEIRAYLSALSGLPGVPAPDGFLESVREKVAKKNRYNDIIELLFYPLKLKIPLEAAGVIGLAVIVFVLYKPVDYLKKGPESAVYEQEYAVNETQGLHEEKTVARDDKTAPGDDPAVPGDAEEMMYPGEERFSTAKRDGDNDELSVAEEFPMVAGSYKESPESAEIESNGQGKGYGTSESAAAPSVHITIVLHKKDQAPALMDKARKKDSLSLQVERMPRNDVARAVKNSGGSIVASEVLHSGKGESITVEIPAGKYDVLITELMKIGQIKDRNMPGETLPGDKSLEIKLQVQY